MTKTIEKLYRTVPRPSVQAIAPDMVQAVLEDAATAQANTVVAPGSDYIEDYVTRFSERPIDSQGAWYASMFEAMMLRDQPESYRKLIETKYDNNDNTFDAVFNAAFTQADHANLKRALADKFETTVRIAAGTKDTRSGLINEWSVLSVKALLDAPKDAPADPTLPATDMAYRQVMQRGGITQGVFESLFGYTRPVQGNVTTVDAHGGVWHYTPARNAWVPVCEADPVVPIKDRNRQPLVTIRGVVEAVGKVGVHATTEGYWLLQGTRRVFMDRMGFVTRGDKSMIDDIRAHYN